MIQIERQFYHIITMFRSDTYDTYCTHPHCIQQNDIFFNYSHDNPHILQHDQHTQAIHARNLQTILRSDENERSFRERYNAAIEEKIRKSVDCVNQKILQFLERKYFTAFGEQMKNKMKTSQSKDARYLLESLKAGNAELVRHIINYRKTEKEITFLNYLKLMETKSIEEDILNSFTHLADKVIEILDLAFDEPNMILNLEDQYMNEIKNKDATPETNLKSSKRKGNSAGDESFEEVSITPNNNKTKPICKLRQKLAAKGPKPVKEKLQEKERIDHSLIRQISPSQQIQLISPREIIILHCSNPLKTFSHILQSHKSITSFHIFAYKFASKDNIRRLFKHFPIEEITFNCDHEFEDSILNELNQQQLNRLRNLELKWALDRFFNEYHLTRQFPQKSSNVMQRVISIKSWVHRLNLANNQTIWIDNDKMAADLKFRSDQMKLLRVLHVASLEKVHLKHIDFPSMTNLTTLNLNGATFAGDNCFAKLINTNPHITTISIYNCAYINSSNVNEALEHLKSLRWLTNFSFMPRGELYVDPFVIAELVHIQNLHLSNVNFFHPKGYTDSSNLKDFSQLKQLKSLSLYACNPIHSDFLSYLDENVLHNLTILNLGFTQVDNICTEHLLKMANLEYLNIDSLDLAGTIFLDLCKLHRQTYNKEWRLKYLSVEQNQLQRQPAIDRFSLETMKEMGAFLPHLQYIYIAHCKSLKDYNFEEFKALRTVALDKQLSQSFPKRSERLNWHVFE